MPQAIEQPSSDARERLAFQHPMRAGLAFAPTNDHLGRSAVTTRREKHMKFLGATGWIAVAMLFPAPAIAQDGSEGAAQRTMEGAQTFLTTLLPNTAVYSANCDQMGWNCTSNWEVEFSIESASADSRCATRFSGKLIDGINFFKSNRPTAIPEINWADVNSISLYESSIKLMSSNKFKPSRDGTLWIKYSDDNSAKRAASAMDFLRSRCDKTASTGF